MPDIKDLLGGQDSPSKKINPLEATPSGGEDNPLKKMDEISKATPDKKESESEELDGDILESMLKTGENTDGMFAPNEEKPKDGEPELHEEEDEEAKVKIGKKAEPQGKYKNMFKKDLLKHPDEYKVQTPKGEMTIAEAIRKGYNPITKAFEEEHGTDRIKERELSRLNDADRQAVEGLIDPSAAQVAPADAEKFGLAPNSPMVRQEQPMGGAPMMPAQGAPAPAPAPQEMPAGPMPQEGAADLAALLGGGL